MNTRIAKQQHFSCNVNVDLIENSDSSQWWNNDKCRCKCKKYHICEKDYFWNPSTRICEN